MPGCRQWIATNSLFMLQPDVPAATLQKRHPLAFFGLRTMESGGNLPLKVGLENLRDRAPFL